MSQSIRDYFPIRDGLPDPKEFQVSSWAIALANKEVDKVLQEKSNEKCKHGKYNRSEGQYKSADS